VVREKDIAIAIAKEMADELKEAYQRENRRRLGATKGGGRSVGRLLEAMHQGREETWRPTYKRDQARFRKFWIDQLGASTATTDVSAHVVEAIVSKEAKKHQWGPATRNRYKRYIVDAYYYGQQKLKWFTSDHNLSAVDFEDPKSKGRAFTVAELQKLLPALEAVDPFAGWLGHVLWQTGRRLTAARTLRKTDVRIEGGRTVVYWPEETDKAGKEGVSVIVGRAAELAAELRKRPGRYMAGAEPPDLDLCEKEWFPAAEKGAGIKHVEGRAWHGIKRRYSTETKGMKGRDKQSGTLESTLRGVYEVDDDLEAKTEVAETLARRMAGA
jgi:integrase